MARTVNSIKPTKRSVDAAPPKPRRYVLWDEELKGFGLRVQKSGVKSFVLRYRPGGGRKAPIRQIVLGRYGVLTVDEARKLAKQNLGQVVEGSDPAQRRHSQRKQMTIAELCDLYFAEGTATKKASTLKIDEGRIKRHIKPMLGNVQIGALRKVDVEKFMRDIADGKTAGTIKTKPRGKALVRGGKGTATKCVSLLGAMYTFALERELVLFSPVRGVKKFPDNKNQNYLSLDDLKRLGDVLTHIRDEGGSPTGVACLWLLALCGARKGEVVGLKWKEVDFDNSCLCLEDSKTGAKIIPLGHAAIELLAEQSRLQDVPWVFPSDRAAGETHYQGIEKIWKKVRQKLDMPQLRIHDLRHSFAAVGATHGQSLPIIGAILGHREVSTTQRYAHLADMPVKKATDDITKLIALAMAGKPTSSLKHGQKEESSINKSEVADLISNLQQILKTG
jgi:integrase